MDEQEPSSDMKRRMLAGELYLANDHQLVEDQARAQRLVERFNASAHDEEELRRTLLEELFDHLGAATRVKPTLRCDYGYNVRIGDRSFLNYDTVLLDVVPIILGDDVQVGPRSQFLTATHPIDPRTRRLGWEAAEPIVVEDNVWFGGGVIVGPGVTVGRDSVIGMGAVVTRDIPPGVVAVGNPARVLREVTDADHVPVPQL